MHVEAFLIDRAPVTNERFARFVAATGHVTDAERPLECADVEPGSLVFSPPLAAVPLDDWRAWWRWVPGANWRRPEGPGSDLGGRALHPVVHVSHDDARAFADWAGGRLPTADEWERAASDGADTEYAWGVDLSPGGAIMANTWQGDFPWRNDGASGWHGTSPVGSFPASRLGLVDMIGNVWEWTSTPAAGSCCTGGAQVGIVTKGGSHLCAPEYCRRYRPAALSVQERTAATSHLGFRIARDVTGR